MNPQQLHELLSGQQRTFTAGLLRFVLSMLEPIYTIGATFNRFLYNTRLKTIHSVKRPVISVGNITTGGTGKTPVTALLVDLLQSRGIHPGIASRGYRALTDAQNETSTEDEDLDDDDADDSANSRTSQPAANDEKLMLDQICPGVPHLQNQNRVMSAHRLIRNESVDCILLDDGFQYRRLHRDLDLVLIDAVNPFGYGHLLPRGLLREPLTSLQRADLIAITRVDQISAEQLADIYETLSYFTKANIIEIRFEPTGWLDQAGQHLPLEPFPKSPLAFCGIGNPLGFRSQLERLGLTIPDERWQPFPDHHHYTTEQIDALIKQAQNNSCELITTHKDLVKLTGLLPTDVTCKALQISAVVTSGQNVLIQKLSFIEPAAQPSSDD